MKSNVKTENHNFNAIIGQNQEDTEEHIGKLVLLLGERFMIFFG